LEAKRAGHPTKEARDQTRKKAESKTRPRPCGLQKWIFEKLVGENNILLVEQG
jgi:hypothetical protein